MRSQCRCARLVLQIVHAPARCGSRGRTDGRRDRDPRGHRGGRHGCARSSRTMLPCRGDTSWVSVTACDGTPASSTRQGQVVAPGFIDIHTHYDAQVFWDPALTPSRLPRRHHRRRRQLRLLDRARAPRWSRAAGPHPAARRGHELRHARRRRALGRVRDLHRSTSTPSSERGVGLNYACYVGHTAVRLFVMGPDAYERAATPDELATMQQIVADAMAGGAAGFATSASPTHNGDGGRPVPSRRRRPGRARGPHGAGARRRAGCDRHAPGRGRVQQRDVRPAAQGRSPVHLDRAPHHRRAPVPRGGHRGARGRVGRRRARCGRRCRAARSCSR